MKMFTGTHCNNSEAAPTLNAWRFPKRYMSAITLVEEICQTNSVLITMYLSKIYGFLFE